MIRVLPLLAWLILLVAGCGGCEAPPAPATGEATAVAADDAGMISDTSAGGVAFVSDAQGEAWSGGGDGEVQVAPGTKLVARVTLRTGRGTMDLFFPECGVARLLAGTTVVLSWETGEPVLTMQAGMIGVQAGGSGRGGVTVAGGSTRMTLRAGTAAMRLTGEACEVAVADGDVRVQTDERPLFVNRGEMLLVIPGGERPAVQPQDAAWPARFAELRGIMHADEFAGTLRSLLTDAAETSVVPVRLELARGYLHVRRLSSQGAALAGSCRVYDAAHERDVFGTTLDFPGDMPLRLPAGTYCVELAYTDIRYPAKRDVVIGDNGTTEVLFTGFGRLELQRALTAELPLFFRIYDAAGEEVTRASLELPPGGGAVELLPGSYRISFVFADRTIPGFDNVTITARQTTTLAVRQ